MGEQVDIIHPQATLHWERCFIIPDNFSCSCVALKDKLYVGTKGIFDTANKLYAFSIDSTSWTTLLVPTVEFALTTYHSQLVLLGGREVSTKRVSEKVWMSKTGASWDLSLPPMPTKRCSASSVNTGSPECLVVAGGVDTNDCIFLTIEVLVDKRWFTVILPFVPLFYNLKLAVNNRNLYIMALDNFSLKYGTKVAYCRLDSLLASCEQSGETISIYSSDLWSEMHLTHEISFCGIISFRQQLVVIKYNPTDRDGYHISIHAFSPLTSTWCYIGDLPYDLSSTVLSLTVLPNRQLVLIGGISDGSLYKLGVFKASLTLSPYSPDSQFSMSALSRLEAADIPVVTSLVKNCKQLVPILMEIRASEIGLRLVMDWWITGNCSCPPTWRSFHDVLKKLDLEELSQQIEEYLSNMTSLKELCMSVIVSALLQQRSLEPDQLHVRLPDYVPPRVKCSITHNFKAHCTPLTHYHQLGALLIKGCSPY